MSHQWLGGSTLKIGKREVPGSILGRACQPSRSEFFVVFSETRVNTSYTLKNQRLKITQLQKARFIKVNELKLSQIELF